MLPLQEFFNWSSGLENMSQKANYERWLMMAQEIYFMTKGVKLGTELLNSTYLVH